MSEHPQFEEDFDLYAIGVLDGDERAVLEGHLPTCAECRSKLEQARARVAMLALAVPSSAPPPSVRERVLERFRTERAGESVAQRPAHRNAVQFRRSHWTPLLAAAALVLLIATVWLGGNDHRLRVELVQLQRAQRQLEESSRDLRAQTARAEAALEILTGPETVKVELTPTAIHPTPHGKAFYDPTHGLLFYATNLQQLPIGRTYELWLIPSEGAPIGAGVFGVDARGNAEVILPAVPQGVTAKAFAVTIEPAGGVAAPTGPKVLIGAVS